MNCPACHNQLSQINIADIAVDVCKGGCGGIWFDNFELNKVDEKHEHAGETLLEVDKNPDVKVDNESKRGCPKCSDIVMLRHNFSIKRKVEIDECGQCAGIWLDAGELGEIRNLYKTEAERNKAAEEYFTELMSSGEFKKMKEKGEADLAKARRFANAFRFVCPTNYIPGKQDWGAF